MHPDFGAKAGGPRPPSPIGFRRKTALQPALAAARVGVPPSGGRVAHGGRDRPAPRKELRPMTPPDEVDATNSRLSHKIRRHGRRTLPRFRPRSAAPTSSPSMVA